jgi:hypothetical protein
MNIEKKLIDGMRRDMQEHFFAPEDNCIHCGKDIRHREWYPRWLGECEKCEKRMDETVRNFKNDLTSLRIGMHFHSLED